MKRYVIISAVLVMATLDLYAQSILPKGSNPPAIAFNYFPNNVYAVVWRNWNLVDPERIAKTIDCTADEVKAMASSMGLPAAKEIPQSYKTRMYITILRRNWHLLPYDQLLILLDMSAEELATALREDDFLFIKLGSLKPKCSPVKYTMPDQKTLKRADEIKQLVLKNFKHALEGPIEPRFSFVNELSHTTADVPDKSSENGSPDDELRFIYSYFGVFGDPLIDTSLDPYPDGLLAKYAAEGVNGVWMSVVLNKMAPGGKAFPEFGKGHEKRISNLRNIVERAEKYGIKVYLYLNEPRAMPVSFFKNRQNMMGVRSGDLATMCTSNDTVRNWLINSVGYIFKQIPKLGGALTITASENLTNCASHGDWESCPRCSKRSYSDIIAGVNTAIAEGVYKGNPKAKMMVWDWGWNDTYTPAIIAKLPKSVWFMSVSEWAKTINRGGTPSIVGEYSMSVVGPGPRAKHNWALAKEAGLKTVAKVQFNNTWELSAVPWIPVGNLVAEHAANLSKEDIDGIMLSWSLGGYPSPNLEIAQAFAQHPENDPETVLDHLAKRRYGKKAAPYVEKAWTLFSKAFQHFPYSSGVLYKAPQQYGPANLIFSKPTGYSASMVGFPYDDLESWRSVYPAEVFAKQFDEVAQGWKDGIAVFKKATRFANPGKKEITLADWHIARAAYLHFASVANQIHYIMNRDRLIKRMLSEAERSKLKKRINNILDNEIELAVQLFKLTRQDSRIGFEASNQYYYVSQDLMEKVIDCEYVRNELIKDSR